MFLGLLCAAFFWRIWTPSAIDRASFAAGDFSGQFYASAVYQSERFWQGQLPLWNPYVYSGHPFLADVQSASFYPPRWITILLAGPGGFTYFALEMEAIAHVFLAGAFTFAFAWRVLKDRLAALVAAIVFAFGGYLTSYPILQLAILETVTWLPLLLLLVDIAFTAARARPALSTKSPTEPPAGGRWSGEAEGSRSAASVGAGLVMAIALLAGHPQTALHMAYLALLYGVWRAYSQRTGWREAAARFAVLGLIGLGASAAQWLPSLEFMRLSTRSELGYDALAGGFALRDTVQMLLPGTTGAWSPLYVGLVPLLLAVSAMLSHAKRLAFFWLAIALSAFVLSLGGSTFLYNLLYQWVPGFNLFRSQERAAGIMSFALAIAAGIGFAALRTQDSPRLTGLMRRTLGWLVAGLVLLAAVLFALWQVTGAPDVTTALDRTVFAAFLALASIGWLNLPQSPPSAGRRLWPMLLLALIVFDLFTINWQTDLERRPPEAQTTFPGLLAQVRADPDLARVDGRDALDGNWGDLTRVHSVNGVSPLVMHTYARLRDTLPKEREWQLLSVKYVVDQADGLSVPAEAIARDAWEGHSLTLFRLSASTPRAWVVHRAHVVDEGAALAALADQSFDVSSEALVSQPVPLSAASAISSSARVSIYEPERIVIDVEAAADGLLVLSELDYPGWHATVDGRAVPVLRANAALRAVVVPAGSHRVEMSFAPASVTLGLALSIGSWLAGSLALVLLARHRWG
ncbi:MAG TPA: YfhO family protein [Anaerolineae bacterium]|nr:YfhO family protein [Anaerolineae bacterium]